MQETHENRGNDIYINSLHNLSVKYKTDDTKCVPDGGNIEECVGAFNSVQADSGAFQHDTGPVTCANRNIYIYIYIYGRQCEHCKKINNPSFKTTYEIYIQQNTTHTIQQTHLLFNKQNVY